MEPSLLNVLSNESYSTELKLNYLCLSDEFDFNDLKTQDVLLKQIKQNLSVRNRYALNELSHVVSRLNNEVVTQNCITWIPCCLKVLQESLKKPVERKLAYKVLIQIFSKLYPNIPQALNNELRTNFVPKFLTCFGTNKTDLYYSVNCLSICATLFGSVIASKRKSIESKIIENVNYAINNNGDVNLLKALGFCYAKVACSGLMTIQRWRGIISIVMNSFEKNILYFNFYKINQSSQMHFEVLGTLDIKQWPSKDKSSDLRSTMMINLRSLYFLTSTICSMISGQYPIMVPVPVEAILAYLHNFAMFIQPYGKKHSTLDNTTIALLQPALYWNIVEILKTLLSVCKTDLLIYTRKINRIVISIIENLEKNSLKAPNLRLTLYQFLADYFTILGFNTLFSKTEMNLIIEHLLANYTVNQITVKVATNSTSDSLKRSWIDSRQSIDCIRFSIKVIKSILNSSGCLLDSASYSSIQNSVIHTLLSIYRNRFNFKYPFDDDNCRVELIESLRLLIENAPMCSNPPLETALVIVREAHRLDNSSSVHSAAASCIHLFNFVLASRIAVKAKAPQLSVPPVPSKQIVEPVKQTVIQKPPSEPVNKETNSKIEFKITPKSAPVLETQSAIKPSPVSVKQKISKLPPVKQTEISKPVSSRPFSKSKQSQPVDSATVIEPIPEEIKTPSSKRDLDISTDSVIVIDSFNPMEKLLECSPPATKQRKTSPKKKVKPDDDDVIFDGVFEKSVKPRNVSKSVAQESKPPIDQMVTKAKSVDGGSSVNLDDKLGEHISTEVDSLMPNETIAKSAEDILTYFVVD